MSCTTIIVGDKRIEIPREVESAGAEAIAAFVARESNEAKVEAAPARKLNNVRS